MTQLTTLIYDDECVSCSGIAQLIGARAPDINRVSFYSPRAQVLLRRHFPDGWAIRPYMIVTDGDDEWVISGAALVLKVARLLGPDGIVKAGRAMLRRARRDKARGGWATAPETRMRAYVPKSPEDAAAFAGEPLILPAPAAAPGLRFERIIQWFNMHGAFQTATYWICGEAGSLVLEQVHRPSPTPEIEGVPGEPVDLGDGRSAQLHAAPAGDGPAPMLTLIRPLDDGRWLSIRANGIERDSVLAIARSCATRGPVKA
jgi:hypothetical protein